MCNILLREEIHQYSLDLCPVYLLGRNKLRCNLPCSPNTRGADCAVILWRVLVLRNFLLILIIIHHLLWVVSLWEASNGNGNITKELSSAFWFIIHLVHCSVVKYSAQKYDLFCVTMWHIFNRLNLWFWHGGWSLSPHPPLLIMVERADCERLVIIVSSVKKTPTNLPTTFSLYQPKYSVRSMVGW